MSAGAKIRSKGRTDWFRILADLQRHGISNSKAAALIGVPQSTLAGWKGPTQPEPSYEDGWRLVTLWEQVTGDKAQDRPRCETIGIPKPRA